MLNDKHIGQWAGYIVEKFDRWRELEKILIEYREFDEVFLDMYKKGYEDCLEDN